MIEKTNFGGDPLAGTEGSCPTCDGPGSCYCICLIRLDCSVDYIKKYDDFVTIQM
ncbi:MAG: hypothetical protein ACYTE8_02680 [Planctomycetota bacterium]|jgi:hypothetical protein